MLLSVAILGINEPNILLILSSIAPKGFLHLSKLFRWVVPLGIANKHLAIRFMDSWE